MVSLFFISPALAQQNPPSREPELFADDAVFTQMFSESLQVARESIKTSVGGQRYISAGPRYAFPARTYYRDAYWTSGFLLMTDPNVVRDEILLLARGIDTDGSVPSALPVDAVNLSVPLWVNHYDAGPYFIMMVYDYLRWTGDQTILEESVNGRRIYTAMEDVLTHLYTLDTDGDFLPDKPHNSLQDWLDTIPRGGEVLYDEVLYYRALRNMVDITALRGDETHATVFNRHSLLVRFLINDKLWNEAKGAYFERCEQSTCEDRLTNESAIAALYDVVSPSKRRSLFLALKQLETSWGVLNAATAYPGSRAYTYQNMTDWPFLDAINAGARLKYGNANWYHPLTRWFTYFAEVRSSGEKLPEFVSPMDLSGGRSQAWSVAPIVSFIRYGLGIDPDLDGSFTVKPSPKGTVYLNNVWLRGQQVSIVAKEK